VQYLLAVGLAALAVGLAALTHRVLAVLARSHVLAVGHFILTSAIFIRRALQE